MKYKSEKFLISIAVILVVVLYVQASAGIDQDEKLFQEAKILIFDKKWEEAQDILDFLLDEYPRSPIYSQALFYKAKCLKEQEGKEAEAIEIYRSYIVQREKNKSLTEASESAIIELVFRLYEKTGRKSYLKDIEKRLYRKNKTVRYYAAFTLSKAKDKKYARKAVPVLENIIETENDEDLRDRARIYLLRVDPDAYHEMEEEPFIKRSSILHIRVQNRGEKTPEFSISIPWALADLALRAIPVEVWEELIQEGYDIDKIVKDITRFKGRILEIKTEDSIIKIWIK